MALVASAGQGGGGTPAWGQEPELSRVQIRLVRSWTEDIAKLERLLDRKRLDQALREHDELVRQLRGIEPGLATPDFLRALEEPLQRLGAARERLVAEGRQPAELPAIGGAGALAFDRDIAPVLVARCGGCHVQGSRGQFSMRTYQALMQSGHVQPGQPSESRLWQLIDSGQMPPDAANRLADDEAAKIRDWIAAGARFGGDAGADLRALGGSQPAAAPPVPPSPSATGGVSFVREIAPVLVANCRGCHVESNRPRGGLDMTSFTALMRGGDRGRAVEPGRGNASLLVRKLRGMADGQRMPQAAPPLDDAVIATIERWINEGAGFDGDEPGTPLPALVALAESAGLDHEQLAARRIESALGQWKLVFPDQSPPVEQTADIILVSSLSEPQRKALLATVELVVTGLKKTLLVPPGEPLVRGKAVLFAVSKRYDLDEFYQMVLRREAAAGNVADWVFTPVDASMILFAGDQVGEEERQAELAHSLAALHVSGLAAGVPRWMANGVGYTAAERTFPKNAAIRNWQERGQRLTSQWPDASPVLAAGTSDLAAGLGAWLTLRQLLPGTAGMKRLVTGLREQGAFESAFESTFGRAPAQVFGARNSESRRPAP